MAKPMELTGLDVVETPSPKAATPARAAPAPASEPAKAAREKVDHVPVQFRFPRDDAKAIKVIAAQRELSHSEFVLMCVREWRERNPNG